MDEKGLLLVLSGPSGAGKGSVCKTLQETDPNLHLSVSLTTRPPRNGEVDGVNYYFVKHETFTKMIRGGQLLEWAKVYGNYYGTPRSFVQKSLDRGNDVILEIDIQGALQVKEKIPEAVLIFIAPPSIDELEKRLFSRGTDSKDEIRKRLSSAVDEIALAGRYDYIVVNRDIGEAAGIIRSIIISEKSRPRYFERFFKQFIG